MIKKNNQLTIAVATLEEVFDQTIERVSCLVPFAHLIVVVQGMAQDEPIKVTETNGMRIIRDKAFGLSRSRNLALQQCDTDYLLLADDDQDFLLDGIQMLYDQFQEHPDMACLVGQIVTPEGRDFKVYPPISQLLNGRQLLGVSSIEMMLNVSVLKDQKVRFDEQFGLGARYLVGEEGILLNDLRALKRSTLFISVPIAQHPAVSSGETIEEQRVIGRGASFARMFGWYGFFLLPVYAIRQQRHYSDVKGVTYLRFFSWLIHGFFSFSTQH